MSSKEYFDNVAEQWDSMRQNFFTTAVREAAFRVAGIKSGDLAADIGAGTGFITEGLLLNGLTVIAVDESEAMLEVLRSKFLGKDIHCYQGESQQLPIADATVDYAFANMYLHHVESPEKAIADMTRIIKPGGKLVLTDLDEHPYSFLREEHHDRWLGFKRAEIVKWFTASGLKDVRVDCLGQNCCTKSANNGEEAAISIFVASGVK